ncbi:MAG: transglycosylase domain-containing protein [Hyphomicrobiales bacterium]
MFAAFDSLVSSGVFEFSDFLKRNYSAYSAWMERWRIWGIKRFFVDLLSDGIMVAMVIAIGVAYFALPPFSGEGDIWNRGRQYAVTFTDINGEVVGQRGVRQDDAIPLSEIPPHVINAVLATEDARFFQHFGVDIQGTIRAAVANAQAAGVVQGGSSLTQQLAKNLFLSPERSLRRKAHEAFLALWIEFRLSKNEILKLYLDRSYMGGGAYGVEAAAQFYFGKSIRDVSLAEAAMLAGLFKAPSKYAPHVNLQAARDRANVVLARMLDIGAISQGEMFAARRRPAAVFKDPGFYSPDYFMDWAYEETLAVLKRQGLDDDYVIEVKTTIDPALQKHAQETVNRMIDENSETRDVTQAALVTMEPAGAVKAIVGGRDYEKSQFNRATEALRQPGSAFKPFVYLTALRKGYRPNSVVYDRPISIRGWSPKNYTRKYRGRVSMTTALAKSINTIPVHLAQAIGRRSIIETAKAVGLESELRPNASMPLGTNEVTVMDITGAYATFANGGRLSKPYTILEIRRPNGDLLYDRKKHETEAAELVVAPKNISDLNYMLSQVVQAGTARRSQLGFTPQAGKTGTTQAYRDAWYIGFTAHYVTGVWFGNDDYGPTKRITGGNLPAMTWKEVMVKALETKVASPLIGVPLDGRYARYSGDDADVEIPLAALPGTNAPDALGADPGADSSADGVTVTRRPAKRKTARKPSGGGVAGAVSGLFSIFGRSSNDRRARTVTVETRQKRRNKRATKKRKRSGSVMRTKRRLGVDSR